MQALQALNVERPQPRVSVPTAPSFDTVGPPTAGPVMPANYQPPQTLGTGDDTSRANLTEALAQIASSADTSEGDATTGGSTVETNARISTRNTHTTTTRTRGGGGTRGGARGGARGGSSALAGILRPGGGWGGSEGPAIAAARHAKTLGVKTSSGKRARMSTASGGVSDHYQGNKNAMARDLSNGSNPTPQMDQLAYDLAKQLGNRRYRKGQPLVFSTVKNGYRYQVLYRTQVGGNHNDHVHFGVKKV